MQEDAPDDGALRLPVEGEIDLDAAEAAALIAFHAAGPRPPLVLVRTWRGEAGMHRNLARRLGAEQPVFSIAPPRATAPGGHPDDVDAWADFCRGRLARVPRRGPLLLGGWSLGGVVAYELARKLAESGEKIALVALLDVWVPDPPPPRSQWVRRLAFRLNQMHALPTRRERRAFAVSRLRRRAKRLAERFTSAGSDDVPEADSHVTPSGRRISRLRRSIWVSYLKYRPSPTPVRMAVFCTPDTRRPRDASLGWSRFADRIECAPVTGTHHTLFDEPHVAVLARHLARSLRRAVEDA